MDMDHGLRLRLAESKCIRQWAQHKLPNGKKIHGQILHPKTVHYQTLKPETNGLFCERIFGPVEEFTCACGRKPLRGQKFCPRCEVEYISTRVRRYRLGYIQLITAAAHTWFFKGQNCYFSLFLNFPKKKVESLLYCTQNISRTIFLDELKTDNNFRPERGRFCTNFFFPEFPISKKIQRFFWEIDRRRIENPAMGIQFVVKLNKLLKKSLWQHGGLRDSALYFGVPLISKTSSWETSQWFSFIFFLIFLPNQGDFLNKYYPGPIGLVNFFGQKSRLFCFTGVQLMGTWLSQLAQQKCNDGKLLEMQIRVDLIQNLELEFEDEEEEEEEKIHLFRRLKYLRSFRHRTINPNPGRMVLSVLPVLPPDLRPILKLDKNQIAVSDFNRLYQMVLLRTRRLARLTNLIKSNCLNSEALQYGQRLLQESVDSLIENDNDKSLSDLFKGKKGRFRQNLLGKRVDYSGRSVIVVGPNLKISECGLPKDMAYELFQPFLLRTLLFQKRALTIFGAKKLLQQKPPFIWQLLQELVRFHPILLNRAPTLHRLSLQAFQPRLIEGKAILLHPLVCSAFNADFDGDQMGVHLPLCFEAIAEAWKITWSHNNLFSTATGGISCLPSQDMILGSSFLTGTNFHSAQPSLDPIWMHLNPVLDRFESSKKQQKLIEIRCNFYGSFQKFRSQIFHHYHPSGGEMFRKIRTTYGRRKFYQISGVT